MVARCRKKQTCDHVADFVSTLEVLRMKRWSAWLSRKAPQFRTTPKGRGEEHKYAWQLSSWDSSLPEEFPSPLS